MKNMTIKNAADVTGGEYIGDPALLERELSFITTDSRKAAPGCLFAAIAGANSDGHDYIPSALASGALCALGQRIPQGFGGPAVLVPDTLTALSQLAEFYRSGFDIPFVGITGSVGKTTAKEMTASVLSRRFRVHKTQGNFNNNLGVPLTLFGLEESHEAAVIEMGISHFGEMLELGRMVRPKYALYTSIGAAHLEFLGDYGGVLMAKTEMLEFMPPEGKVFINGDDPTLLELRCSQERVSFGLSPDCDVRAESIRVLGAEGMALTIVKGSRRFEIRINSFGLHLVTAALGAAAIGMELGLTDNEIAEGIAAYVPVGGRSALEKTDKLTIINDCYNANPTSTVSALDSLAILPCSRRVAILGDMLELGEKGPELHRQCGGHAAVKGVELLLTTGELSLSTYEGALEAGCPDPIHFDRKETLIASLPELIRPGDAVLVKASHSRRFEEIVAALKEI